MAVLCGRVQIHMGGQIISLQSLCILCAMFTCNAKVTETRAAATGARKTVHGYPGMTFCDVEQSVLVLEVSERPVQENSKLDLLASVVWNSVLVF